MKRSKLKLAIAFANRFRKIDENACVLYSTQSHNSTKKSAFLDSTTVYNNHCGVIIKKKILFLEMCRLMFIDSEIFCQGKSPGLVQVSRSPIGRPVVGPSPLRRPEPVTFGIGACRRRRPEPQARAGSGQRQMAPLPARQYGPAIVPTALGSC